MWGIVERLDTLCDWAKEALNTDELNNNLLLVKDDDGIFVLYHTSFRENVHVCGRYTSGIMND